MAGSDGPSDPNTYSTVRRLSNRLSSRTASSTGPDDDGNRTAGEDERTLLQGSGDQDQDQDEDHDQDQDQDTGARERSRGSSEERKSESSGQSDKDMSSRPSVSDAPGLAERRPSQQHRVRFSEDVQRSSGPDAATTPHPASAARQRHPPGGLTVDTNLRPSQSGKSPTSPRKSPLSPTSPPPGPLPAPAVSASPSTKSRNRGYSLRRSLFTKNLHGQPSGDDSPIELQQQQQHQGSSSDAGSDIDPLDKSFNEPGKDGGVEVRAHEVKNDSAVGLGDGSRPRSQRFTQYRRLSKQDNWIQRQIVYTKAVSGLKVAGDAFRKHVLRVREIPPSKDGRHIDLDACRAEPLIDERTGKPYINNFIRSSRYSLWSFFPKQLIAQFSKVANFYFLIVAILQMIPGLSTTGTFTTFVPLMIFVGISMGKEGLDDLRRYKLDREENNRTAWVLRPDSSSPENNRNTNGTTKNADDEEGLEAKRTSSSGDSDVNAKRWVPIKWVDIQVGEVILLQRDKPVPADVVLLHADDPNGIAYIETMALDGETNLKSKQPCPPLAKACATTEDITSSRGVHFAVEDPNIDLYKFDGNVTADSEKLPLTNAEVIYRGSILRNSRRAIGMVIYTGEECKIRMNATKNPRIKAPALQTVVNRVVMVIVLFVVTLAGACTIAYRFWSDDVEDKSWYLKKANVSYGPIFTSFLIMFNTMIPISLYVSLEIVKVAQMFLLNDVDMYDEASDTPLEARTSTINEELGQVSYIFSDKTGTLTNNSMRFRKMSVAGTAWLHETDLLEEEAEEANKQTRRRQLSKKKSKGKKAAKTGPNTDVSYAPRKSSISFKDEPPHSPVAVAKSSRISSTSIYNRDQESAPRRYRSNRRNRNYHGGGTDEMLQYIDQKSQTIFARRAKFFILGLALCHTAFPETDEEGNVIFQAASPDEVALVMAARDLGYVVVDRQPTSVTLRTNANTSGEDSIDEVYEVLDVIEFSSARKRMSIVVRMPDGRICVFCKGADSTIMQLLKQKALAMDKVGEIERRVSKRKNMEAVEVMRRNSEHVSAGGGKKDGKSLSLRRPSLAAARRSSVSGARQSGLRDSVDAWLRDRETDGGMDLREEETVQHYSPRPSMQALGGRSARGSTVLSDGRPSFQTTDDEYEGELVEESLVVNDAMVFERCFQHLNDFATEGLRTLLYGYRFIDDDEYREWKDAYNDATTSLVDRQEKIEQVGAQLEDGFELLGATAIEDKLQKGVPEAIDKLRRANIKLWMLTGDKRETAINIGHSCRLVKDYSSVVIIDSMSGEDLESKMMATVADIEKGAVAHSVVVVDGPTLSTIEADDFLMEPFFNLAILADSVICCRASPKQKAFLVKSIRKRVDKSITLAIGDGANDIAMIQEAHVGIGIAGKEGLQAARISDYSIAQFRFLLKLLLVHGRWNYVRVCKYTLGTFWKETVFYLTQALYQRWNGYTGTSLYEPWGLSMFNTLFTSLPVIFLGIFEKDLAASTLLAVPELYNIGQRHAGFNIKKYLWWAFMATCEAMIVYFTMFSLFGKAGVTLDNGVFVMGMLSFSACVILISAKLQVLEIHDHTIMTGIAIFLSIGGWWLWNILLSARYHEDRIYNVRNNFLPLTGQNLLFWVTLLVAFSAPILLELAVSTIRAALRPTDVDLFQQLERDESVRKRFEEAAASELQQGWEGDDVRARKEKEATKKQKRRKGTGTDDGEKEDETEPTEQPTQTDPPATPEERETQIRELLERRRRELDERERRDDKPELPQQEDGDGDGSGGGGGSSSAAARGSGRRSLDINELLNKGFGAIRRGQEL